jgi:hypothetical protein
MSQAICTSYITYFVYPILAGSVIVSFYLLPTRIEPYACFI